MGSAPPPTMWLTLKLLLLGASLTTCQEDQLAVAASSLDSVAPSSQASILPPSLPKATGASSSPLALLLATANKPAAPLPLLPLAPLVKPTGVRIKRKPQISKFRPKDRKRFRPRGRVTASSVTKVPGDDDEKKEEEEEEEYRIKE